MKIAAEATRAESGNELKKKRFIILGYLAVVTIYQLIMREYSGDAVRRFSHFLEQGTLQDMIAGRYAQWSSRTLIDIILTLLAHNMHYVLFGILNVAFEMLLYLSTLNLFHYRHTGLVTLLFLTYPVISMGSVGWMAVFTNYLWPLAAAVFSFTALQSMYENRNIAISTGTFFIIAEIFACNFETLAVCYLVILGWFTIAMTKKKGFTGKRIVYTSVMYAVCVISIIIAVVCPGNRYRINGDTTSFMKYFPSLSFADKAAAGITATFSVFTDRSILYLVFSAMLFIMVLSRKERPAWLLYVSAVPFTAGIVRTVLKPVMTACFPQYSTFFDNTDSLNIDALNYSEFSSYLPFILYMVIFVSIILVYLYSFDDLMTSLECVAVFVGAFITREAMGFTPTLYNSSDRTFIFMDMAFIWLTVKEYDCYHAEINSNTKLSAAARLVYPMLAAVMIAQNIIAISAVS